MKQQTKRILMWLKVEKANTAEENTNRGLWWIVGILALAVVAGVAWYIIGHEVSQAQQGASTVTTSMASQSGLDGLASNAVGGSVSGSQSTVGSGYKAP